LRRDSGKGARIVAGRLIVPLALLLGAAWPGLGRAQTPSPLQEWQYSGGTVLQRLFEPNMPEWHTELGLATVNQPLYTGAQDYRLLGGPVVNVRYKDIAFASVGEGVGVNLVRGENYRVGIAIGYDMGRRVSDDLNHLRGLGDIEPAPVIHAFESYVISKEFPLVIRSDIRRIVGGAEGFVGDIGTYLPLPGSSQKFAMFAGPSVTFADHEHSQRTFGINATQSLASGYPIYNGRAGLEAAGLGFSATRFLTPHWLINMEVGLDRLLGSASDSPITQRSVEHVFVLSGAYSW
jgi:outer membrane scaffolding protein for murein synthesis (MipA/OmpV family)